MNRAAWWIAFLSFALAVSAVWGVAVLRDRSGTLAQAAARLEATANLLEQHADRAMAAGDRVLLSTEEAVRTLDLGDEANRRRLHDLARRLVAGSPQLSSFWLLDPAGDVVMENWGYPPRSNGNFASRAYFAEARDAPGALVVGPLGIGTTTGRPRFTISRALADREGRFAGVVVASVLSEYFAGVYGRAGLPPDARLVLALRDGRTLAQWPPEAAGPPGDLAVRRDLDRYPVRLEVSARSESLLAPWRSRALWGGAGVLAAIAAFGGLCIRGHRGAVREEAARGALAAANRELEARVAERTAALAEGQAELHALYDTAPVGMCLLDRELRYLRINQRLAEINGLPPEAHLGRTVRELLPGIADAAEALARKLFETGEPLFNVEITGETPARPGVMRS
jgi:C4-dicarboxylate-specific signal transduction histidine kinase